MSAFNLYACFIGDGYAEVESPRAADDDTPESESYWYTPRNAEVDCPTCNAGAEPPGNVRCDACDGTGSDGLPDDAPGTGECPECDGKGHVHRTCPTCDGSGHVHGEPFTVTRYTFPTLEAAELAYAACEDAGDGYERASVLAKLVASGACVATDVIDWTPDYL
jgi:RecJ-like exonuclease